MKTSSEGRRLTLPKRCRVPIRTPAFKLPVPCGDRVFKAGQCEEHFTDAKHAREARRGQPAVVTAHLDGRKNHGTGQSASAVQNKKDRAARLMRRKVA